MLKPLNLCKMKRTATEYLNCDVQVDITCGDLHVKFGCPPFSSSRDIGHSFLDHLNLCKMKAAATRQLNCGVQVDITSGDLHVKFGWIPSSSYDLCHRCLQTVLTKIQDW